MSASPQPPPPAPALRDDPAPHSHPIPSPPASSSPAQLAALLTKSLQEAEALKAELAAVKRRADKAERLLATFQSSSAHSPSSSSPPDASAKSGHLSDAARKAILDFENRAERAEQARDEAEARLRMLQDSWSELERFLAHLDVRNADARAQFSRIVQDAGGPLVPVSSIPPAQNTVYLPSALHHQQPIQLPPLLASRSHTSARSRIPASSQPFPSVALPPPPSASSSRVRPRAGSMDAAYNGVLSGPGAPPPAKRPRADRDSDHHRDRHYSLSPSNSPGYVNGHAIDHSPTISVHHANPLPAIQSQSHYQPYHHSRRSDRDDPAAARYAPGAYPDHHHHRHHRRGRSTSRGRDRDRSSHSRSRSRASSLSLEEMLIEATTTPADERPGPDGHVQTRPPHPSQQQQQQQLHPSSRRSPSPGHEHDYHLAVPSHHSRSRAHSSAQLHPHAPSSGSPPGPLPVQGQVKTYQMHIFAPPVTGAPVKKTKLGAAGSTLSANGSVLTLGPTGSVISGPSSIGGGGFPPTNAQGQRICRQCGLPGRYKDGKCVEKWGPGPEGPGTVCDRCRKKMKRVERRGTIDSQNLAAQMHHPPAAVHPSGAAQAQAQAQAAALSNGRVGGGSIAHSLHRSDTVQIHSSHSHAQSQSRTLGGTSTHLLSAGGSPPGSYARHDRDRDRDYDRPADSPPHSQYSSGSRPAGRSPPTPPYIATLPNSGTHDDDGSAAAASSAYEDAPRARERPAHQQQHHKGSVAHINGHRSGGEGSASSRSASHSPAMPAKTAATGAGASARGSPRGSDGNSKSSELMDVDADGEEVDADADADVDADVDVDADADDADADADAEADAEAELLEAVDAAEANNASGDEWLKKEDA